MHKAGTENKKPDHFTIAMCSITRVKNQVTRIQRPRCNLSLSLLFVTCILLESCSRNKTFTPEQIDSYAHYDFGVVHAYFSNGKWGFFRDHQDTITAPIYDDIELSYREIEKRFNIIKVQYEGKWGIIASNGKSVLPCIYENIITSFPCHYPLLFAKENKKWRIYDTLGKPMTAFKYDTLYGDFYIKFSEGMAIRINGKVGAISCKDFTEIIPPVYDTIWVVNDVILKVKNDNKVGLIETYSARIICPLKFEDVDISHYESYNNGIRVKLNGKWGVTDTSGKEIFPVKYDRILNYTLGDSGRADVCLNKKYGSVDRNGKEIIPIMYDEIYTQQIVCCTLVRIGDKFGVINRDGKILIPVKYEDLAHWGGGNIIPLPPPTKAKMNGKWGYLDSTGKEVTPFKYDEINTFCYSTSLIPVKYGDKWGFIDKSGKEIEKFLYDNMECNEYSFFIGQKANENGNGNLGIIDNTYGKAITSFIYQRIIPLDNFNSKGVIAAVRLNDQWGFIDNKGNQLVKPKYQFEEIKPYTSGLAAVEKEGKWGFINKAGTIIIPIKYDEISGFFSNGVTGVSIDGKWGIIDSTGKITSPINSDFDMVAESELQGD